MREKLHELLILYFINFMHFYAFLCIFMHFYAFLCIFILMEAKPEKKVIM